MPRVTIHCAYCGKPKEIKPCAVREHNFCGRTCYHAYREKEPDQHCAHCNKPIKIRPSGRKVRNYCSPECSRASRLRRVEAICPICGKSFEMHQSQASNGRQYCSQECFYLHARNRIARTCEVCGALFEAIPAEIKRRNSRFCSKVCFHIHNRQANHWLWKGGISNRIIYGSNWPKIARAIRKRDNYICQHCGKRQKRFAHDVHHIRPFREFNGDTVQANHPSNLITLCRACHKQAEYGIISIQPKLL